MNKLPDGWQIKTIKEVCNIYTGNSISKEKKEKNFIGLKEGLNYIGTKDINLDNIINYDNGVKIPFKDLKDFKIAKSNSTLLCIEGGSAGRKIGFTNQDICFGNKLCCFEAIEDAPKFIYYYLQSDYFLEEFYSNIQGLIGGVPKENLKKIKIHIPPLEEQKRIASGISKIDAYLENTIKLIEEKERFKKGISKKLLTCKEGENVPEMRFKEFNDKWETKTLISVANIKKGEQRNKLDLIPNGKYPVLNGGMNFSGYYNSYNREANTITISEGGNAGYVNFIKEKFWSSGHCYTLHDLKIDKNFLYQCLKNSEKRLMKLRHGTALKNIKISEIIEFTLDMPKSIEEQKIIGEYLSLLDAEIDNLKEQKEEIKKMKSGIIKKLMPQRGAERRRG